MTVPQHRNELAVRVNRDASRVIRDEAIATRDETLAAHDRALAMHDERLAISDEGFPSKARTRSQQCASAALALLCTAACASQELAPSDHATGGSHAVATTSSGKKELTFESLYGEGDKKVDFNGNPPHGFVWLDDEHYLWPKSDPKTHKNEWLRVEATTGKSEPFADAAKATAAMAAIPGVAKDEAARLAFSDASGLSKDHTKILVTIATPEESPKDSKPAKKKGSDLYAYTFGADNAVRLTNTPDDEEENAQWSPDGKHVSFVRGNDLYVVDLDPVAEHRITSDGGEMVLNGKLDWLYQEEVYGRGNFGAAWWSSDSKSIAFLRIDEHGVPPYTLVNDIPFRPEVETSPYPRAGETNPTVKLGVANVVNGAVASNWIDLAKYTEDFLIVDVAWSPKNELVFQVQDREQRWLDLNAADRSATQTTALQRGNPRVAGLRERGDRSLSSEVERAATAPVPARDSLAPDAAPNSVSASDRAAAPKVGNDAYSLYPAMVALGSAGLAYTLELGAAPAESKLASALRLRAKPGAAFDTSLPMRTLFRETSPAWVDNPGSPKWLDDGTFLISSERSGWKHLYHYKSDGTLIGAVTSGKWEARALNGVDEKKGFVYFSGTERSPIGGDIYRVKLDGSGLERLTQAKGSHTASFNPAFTYFIDHWSSVTTPTQVRLHRADGSEVRTIDENRIRALDEYALSTPELLQVKTRDGFAMEAMLIKPPHFDPSKRYPVFQSTYAGPHAPQVRDAWGGTGGMFLQLLAQKGIVVWVCDNRTASGKGAESEWPAYKRFGETELADIEDGIAWLKQQPWVDASRIGISGWSFGGFMTSYALTHSTSFAMGIAGGTVSDWMNYDSIYTERYMQTPAHNPEGYKKTSVTAAAKNLHGKLLLIHGAIDDNVHPQSSMQLAYELQKADTQFQFMLYPKSRHGVGGPLRKHLQQLMLEFIEETLLGGKS